MRDLLNLTSGRSGAGSLLLPAAVILIIINVLLGALYWCDSTGGSGVGISDFPLDDGWIHLVYTRNLATGFSPDYNDGAAESGMTSPLWVFINALAYPVGRALSLNPTIIPKFFSLAFAAISSIIVLVILQARCGRLSIALAAALLLTVDPRWSFSRASGMEPTLFTMLLLMTFLALDRRKDLLAGLSFGLACLARPEGLVLAPLLVAARFLPAGNLKGTYRTLARLLLPAALLVGCWFIYNLSVTGRVLPNTFYVKAQVKDLFRPANLQLMWSQMLISTHFFRNYLGIILYLAGVAAMVRSDWRGNISLILFPWLFFFSLSVTHTFLQGEPYYWDRYLHPVIPFFIIPIFMAFKRPLQNSEDTGQMGAGGPGQKFLPAAVAAALVFVSYPGVKAVASYSSLYSLNCRDIRTGNVETGKWLKAHTQPGEWIATMDSGAIRFFSERNVLDVVGLNNHRLLAHEAGAPRYRYLLKQFEEVEPSYYVFFPRIFSGLIREMGLEPVKVITMENYSIIRGTRQSVIAVYVRGDPP